MFPKPDFFEGLPQPLVPEFQYLKDIENLNGGPEGMEKLFRDLMETPFLLNAFVKYLHYCFMVIKYNPEYKDQLVDSTDKTIKSCLTGDGLKLLLAEINAIPEPKDEKEAKIAADRLQAIVDKLNQCPDLKLPVVLPRSVAAEMQEYAIPMPSMSGKVH